MFFARQGRPVEPTDVKLSRANGHMGPLGYANSTSIAKRVGMRPQNIKSFQFLVKSRTPLTDFENF